MQIYTGKSPGQATGVKKKTMYGCVGYDRAYVVIMLHNVFTTFKLGEQLVICKLTMLGAIRNNKPELPKNFLEMKTSSIIYSLCVFTNTTENVSYCPKKVNVLRVNEHNS